MIFNWYENCKTVLKHKRYTDNDAYDHKTMRKQECFLIKYLFMKGYSVNDVYKKWLEIKGGTADLFDREEEQCKIEFDLLVKSSKHIPDNIWFTEQPEIVIYQSEIDYLNSLEAPLWVRKYWLGMLFWYKFMKIQYGAIKNSVSVEGWVYKQVDSTHEFKHKHGEISSWGRKVGNPFKKDVSNNGTVITVNWLGGDKTSDKATIKYSDPCEFVKYFKFLSKGTRVCRICGAKFDFSSKTQRDICEKCWKKDRKKQKISYITKVRSKL